MSIITGDNNTKIYDIDGDLLSTKEVKKVIWALYAARNYLRGLHGLKATDIPGTEKMPEDEKIIIDLDFAKTIKCVDLALILLEENSRSETLKTSEIMAASLKISEALNLVEYDFNFAHGLIAFARYDKKPFTIDTTRFSNPIHESICILDRIDNNRKTNCS